MGCKCKPKALTIQMYLKGYWIFLIEEAPDLFIFLSSAAPL
jgi:hypothetical protein